MKKGFTLVETLGVVAILGLIFTIAFPGIAARLKKAETKTKEAADSYIIETAKDYVSKEYSKMKKYYTGCIQLSTLEDEGYLASDILEDSGRGAESFVEVTSVNGKKDYTFVETCVEEDEVFSLKGSNSMEIAINSEYREPGINAYSSIGEDLSKDVNIIYYVGEDIVHNIDTTVSTTYIVKYVLGENELTRTVVVKDSTPPQIIFDRDSVMIPSDITSFNLYEGVTVIDDSSYTLTTSGTLSLGVVGTYVITYTATDAYSNVSTKDRTFIILVGVHDLSQNNFSSLDWGQIVTSVYYGYFDSSLVGATKTVNLGALGTYTLRVANVSKPSTCSNTSFSQTACGFVLEFADMLDLAKINNSNTNTGSWNSSAIRTYINNNIYNALPADLKNAIINTRVITGHGMSESSNFTSTDKLYLLSPKEVWKNVPNSNEIDEDSAINATR